MRIIFVHGFWCSRAYTRTVYRRLCSPITCCAASGKLSRLGHEALVAQLIAHPPCDLQGSFCRGFDPATSALAI
ncbi:hypothetical protein PoB_000200300 [Plakobranchus ocellatus]|uniref:Uncharacterized protein n=1 Tax=Plakobranchus ocellatus TaxID=259542 RepID=A0AAV3XYQ5_9GAST|nr:hypothetical protein PoB_000200300 [Plakobranchus ocellatus]